MTSEGFQGYPEDHVMGAFDSRADAAKALDDARAEGIPEHELAVYSGEQGAAEIDSSGTGPESGVGGFLLRSVQLLMTNRDRMEQYEHAINAGGVVLAGRADDDERKRLLAAVFQRNNGRDVRYFGAMTVEDLSVDPSRTRMEDSPTQP